MRKSITRNYIYNVIYQILALITPLVTTPYISRVLGADGVGIYSYTFSIVSYFIILGTLGINDYAQREIAYKKGNTKEQSKIFVEVICLRMITTFISLAAYYFFVLIQSDNYDIYLVQALNILTLLFDISWFYQGLEEFGKIVCRNIIVRVLNVIFIFVFIRSADDLNKYILLMAGMNIIGGMSMCLYLPKYLCRFDLKKLNPFRNFGLILQLFLPQIAIQVYVVLDKTMIGVITGSPVENGYYEQAEKIAKMPLTLLTSLGTVMLPRMAIAYTNNDHNALSRYMMRSYRFVWALGIPLMFGLMGISENLIPWFLGTDFGQAVFLLQIFSVLILAIGLSNVTGIQYMIPTNKQNKLSLTLLIGAFFNFFMNLFMIHYYRSMGAAVTSVLTEILITSVQFIFIRRIFSIGEILKMSERYFTAGGIMFIVIYIIGKYLLPAFINTVCLMGIGVTVYIFCLYFMKDAFFIEGCRKIKRIFKS